MLLGTLFLAAVVVVGAFGTWFGLNEGYKDGYFDGYSDRDDETLYGEAPGTRYKKNPGPWTGNQ